MNRAETNQALMKQFETMINTADEELSRKLISEKASFFTPASPVIWRQRLFICCALDAPGVF